MLSLIRRRRLVGELPDAGDAPEAGPDRPLRRLVVRVEPQPGEMPGEPANGGGVGATVVVEDDHQSRRPRVGDVVERLVGHAAGERAVADDHHRGSLPTRRRHPHAVAEGSGGVAVLDPVVRALLPARIPGQAAVLAEGREAVGAPGEDLVYICLVPDVPDDGVVRAVEDAVQRQRQLDDPEVGGQVPAGLRHLLDEVPADGVGEHGELVRVEAAQVTGEVEVLEQVEQVRIVGHVASCDLRSLPPGRPIRHPGRSGRARGTGSAGTPRQPRGTGPWARGWPARSWRWP